MENREPEDEPQKKRPHLSSPLSPSAANNNQTVDIAALQQENQRLVQQLEMQKREMQQVEADIKGLEKKQTSYDNYLMFVNKLWNQLNDDLILLSILAGKSPAALKSLDHSDYTGGSIPSCSPEKMFLSRLLGKDCVRSCKDDEIYQYVEEALSLRRASTMELMNSLEDTIATEIAKTERIAQSLHGIKSMEDTVEILSTVDAMLKVQAENLATVVELLHVKHQQYCNAIGTYLNTHSEDQSEIKQLAGELEEVMLELDDSRRKFLSFKMEKDEQVGMCIPAQSAVNGSLSPEKPADRSKGSRELKDSIEETKLLAADRLSELQDAQDENQVIEKELEDLQNQLKDQQHIVSSRLYHLVTDQLHHYNAELEKYKALTDTLQAERPFVMRREKEINAKLESANAARSNMDTTDSRIEELENQLQRYITEKNDLEIKMEEALQDSGRKDVIAEFRVMASALSKEMSMMEAQVNRWKETAEEAATLRERTQSLRTLVTEKTNQQKLLEHSCTEQAAEIKSLKASIEKLQKQKLEKQIMLDMYGQEGSETRDLLEIKESESRAVAQAEALRNALNEHSLELRVKAANEAEEACQRRLSAAEAEIAELRAELDASDCAVLELKESIKSKDREGEACISEIETIGQAYEDMQTQNQHLLQQLAERDDYNIKLVSESVKAKQLQSSLLSEKQAVAKQLQQVNALIEVVKMKIDQSEEQMRVGLAEAIRLIEEDRHLGTNLETARWELADAEKEAKWLKHAVSSSDKEYEQIQKKFDETQKELNDERSERKKLQEELAELNNKFAEMSSETGEAAIQRLQDELKECKSMLKCSVCSDRPKEVVIVKCYHLFCNPCIQRNLEIRHRKCPACGTAFGQNDVRMVKI